MTEQERDNLMELHRLSLSQWALAEHDGRRWHRAYAAHDAFVDALMTVQVTQ